MAAKRHKHLSHNHLGDTKTILQQNIKKMPPLSPRKISHNHLPITKQATK